jgi:hypothetical protein
MSSVHVAKSQVAPFKRYIVNTPAGGSQTGRIYDAEGGNGVTVAAGSVLRDMGKTVFYEGTPLRKVQVLPVEGSTSSTPFEFRTGYIYLENVPALQNIVSLN